MSVTIGIDTSNYTTSAAWFDGTRGENVGKLLEVAQGSLGLRQSDALFQHVKRLPGIVDGMLESVPGAVEAVGASTQPRALEGSYMPCFLAGETSARNMSSVLKVPFYPCSHQQGHVAAAAWSAGHMELLDQPMLVWHLSGGTTELLRVTPNGVLIDEELIGGTTDISAGQLIDRTGKRLGMAFPSGKQVDAASQQAQKKESFKVKVKDSKFSFSGVENKMNQLADKGETLENICWYVLMSVIRAVDTATRQALEKYPDHPVLLAGGVASNLLMRQTMQRGREVYFAEPRYSTDNAMGVAILTWRQLNLKKDSI